MNKNRKLTILYASQTGCSKELAEQIFRESKIYSFSGPIMSMDEYNIEHLIDEKLVIFVCSTTGQGTEPDNMKLFWKFLLRKSLPPTSLVGLNYAVLGMGDSSYRKFNFVAKRLNKRLHQLGGKEILPIGKKRVFEFFTSVLLFKNLLNSLGLCDDQHDLGSFGTIHKWLPELWSNLGKMYPLPDIEHEKLKQFKWKVSKSSNKAVIDYESIYDNCKDAIFDKPFIGTLMV